MNIRSKYDLRSAVLFLGCIFLSACENSDKDIKGMSSKTIGIEEAKNVVVRYSIGGRQKAVLSGPLMYRVQDTVPYIEFPSTIHVDFFNSEDSIESILDAKYAKYKETQKKVFLKDSVRIINVKGDTLYSDELYWDRSRTNAEFYTEKPVKIRTRTHIINGIGMEARQDFKEWHILQSTGEIKVPTSQFPN